MCQLFGIGVHAFRQCGALTACCLASLSIQAWVLGDSRRDRDVNSCLATHGQCFCVGAGWCLVKGRPCPRGPGGGVCTCAETLASNTRAYSDIGLSLTICTYS
jgi:hypothetical protein